MSLKAGVQNMFGVRCVEEGMESVYLIMGDRNSVLQIFFLLGFFELRGV